MNHVEKIARICWKISSFSGYLMVFVDLHRTLNGGMLRGYLYLSHFLRLGFILSLFLVPIPGSHPENNLMMATIFININCYHYRTKKYRVVDK